MSVYWRAQRRACRCTDGLSATQNDLGRQGVSAPCGDWTHDADSLRLLNLWAMRSYRSPEEKGLGLVVPRNLEPIFCVQDFHSRVARVETTVIWTVRSKQVESWSQARYNSILDHKPFIDTRYRIGHRLELKYFHFAQFLLNEHEQLIDLRKGLRTWNLGQIFEIELWVVGEEHSRWLFTKADCSKNLKLKIEAHPVTGWILGLLE